MEILRAMHDDGWRTVRSGPYTDAEMFPRLDMYRFLFIMERDVVTSDQLTYVKLQF